jgi:hypothetical protein
MGSRKDEILGNHVISSAEAAKRLGVSTEDSAAWASLRRDEDELFGVWSSHTNEFVHPDFQFGPNVTPAQRKELFRILRTRAGFDPVAEDSGGWARAYWLYQPSAALSEVALAVRGLDVSDPVKDAQVLARMSDQARTPADVFADDPRAVIALAAELAAGQVRRD